MVHWQHREVMTVAHVKHFAMGDARKLTHELERDKKPTGEWAFTPTGKIDAARTHLNYKLGGSGRAADRVAARLADPGLRVAKRRDLNVMSDWVITCPEALQADLVKRDRFFQLAYEFVQGRYGAENVMPAAVHLDETSPHMHVPVVPVKDGRVSAKALFTRGELAAFHTDLDKACEFEFGIKGLIRNGRTKGNYTTAELKQRTADEERLKQWEAVLEARERAVAVREAQAASDSRKASKQLLRASEALQEAEKALEAGRAYEAEAAKASPLSSDDQAVVICVRECLPPLKTGEVRYDAFVRIGRQHHAEQQQAMKQAKQKAQQGISSARKAAMSDLEVKTLGLSRQEYDDRQLGR